MRKSNDAWKEQLDQMDEFAKEMSTTAKIEKHGPLIKPSADLEERAKGLYYLIHEYDNIKSFKVTKDVVKLQKKYFGLKINR